MQLQGHCKALQSKPNLPNTGSKRQIPCVFRQEARRKLETRRSSCLTSGASPCFSMICRMLNPEDMSSTKLRNGSSFSPAGRPAHSRSRNLLDWAWESEMLWASAPLLARCWSYMWRQSLAAALEMKVFGCASAPCNEK